MACVVQWFETKNNYPQCRHGANEKNLRKIYLEQVCREEGLLKKQKEEIKTLEMSKQKVNEQADRFKTQNRHSSHGRKV